MKVARTSVVDPNICDLLQYSPTEIGFIGKALGTTKVTVSFREDPDKVNDPNGRDADPQLHRARGAGRRSAARTPI